MTRLLVDSACDLPRSVIEKANIALLPATIIYDQQSMQDYREPEQMIRLYKSGLIEKGHSSETAPTSSDDIYKILEGLIKQGESEFIIQTVNRARSPTFEHATDAIARLKKKYPSEDLVIRLQDSRTIFTGQAVLAAHTLALLKKGVHGTQLRRVIDGLSSQVHAYQVPRDVYYLRERARKKGDNSISWFGAVIGRTLHVCPILLALDDHTFPVARVRGFDSAAETLFRHTIEKVNAGLLSPFVAVSYAGDPSELRDIQGFAELQAAVKARKYQMIISPMSLSGGVNLGPGTLSIGFATEPYQWETEK